MHSGHVRAKAAFATMMLTELAQRLPTGGLANLFGLSLANEATYESGSAPFDATHGTVSSADGLTYNLSSPASRQQVGGS